MSSRASISRRICSRAFSRSICQVVPARFLPLSSSEAVSSSNCSRNWARRSGLGWHCSPPLPSLIQGPPGIVHYLPQSGLAIAMFWIGVAFFQEREDPDEALVSSVPPSPGLSAHDAVLHVPGLRPRRLRGTVRVETLDPTPVSYRNAVSVATA